MQKLLVICGPTGTGKTDLALSLAEKFNGELVSADSRQVYIGMDIGTGKELVEVKRQKAKGKKLIQKFKNYWLVGNIPTHLYDVKNPDERFSLAEYQQLALARIKEIQSRKKLPILVGGTGLYIQAVTEGLNIPKAPPDFKLRERLENERIEVLLSDLEKFDPKTYQKIDKNNKRRIVRALEVYYQLGEPFSKLQEKYKVNFDILKIGLSAERNTLYQKVDKRIEQWFENGFIAEVKILIRKYSPNLASMSSVGYRQAVMFIQGKLDLSSAKLRMKFDTHGYIRRQLTWFKRDPSINWYDITMENTSEEVSFLVKSFLEKESNDNS